MTLPAIGAQSSARTTTSSPDPAGARPLVSVVVITRDRRTELLDTLRKLLELPETPPVIVVDNGSRDGTAEAVSSAHPTVDVVRLPSNAGAAARNIGVSLAETPFVAFADDDSGWEPGALSRAADIFGRHPDIALVAARVLNGPGREIDAACRVMAEGLPQRDALPGPPVLGFIACGAIVQRERFLAAGGFPSRYGVGGEEAPLALALASAGWALIYAPDVVALHHPSPARDTNGRASTVARNDLWLTWGHRPWPVVVSKTMKAVLRAIVDRNARDGLVAAAAQARAVLRERRLVTSSLESDLRLLERRQRSRWLPPRSRRRMGSDQARRIDRASALAPR